MRRVGILWVSWLLWQLAAGNDAHLQQLVSVQKPAQTVSALFQELTRQTGVPLFPAPPLDKELLIVKAQQISLRLLMDASWSELPAEVRRQLMRLMPRSPSDL
ncbi:MAG: hypothetical protein KatS3mg016_1531 [Fimbriimonadales bacterium]|nr:MAG: hypothetical protein KatS3mg016_1531 [Fimbriimonadales bacterium]